MKKLFTERYGMTEPRIKEELDVDLAKGLLTVINAKIDENLFGESFSRECPDNSSNSYGCDIEKLKAGLAAYNVIWPREWPNSDAEWPTDPQLFDLIEFLYEHAGLPEPFGYHSFFQHDHLTCDKEEGRAKFEKDINRFFERNGIAFELKDGEVTRIAPTGLQEVLAETVFDTGDSTLDRLLKTAREKFLNRALDVRKEGLEKLWDAWERLKTIEPGKDKKAQITALLDRATKEPNYRAVLEAEAMALTKIGNDFMIRHTETNKTEIKGSARVDYLFHRMFALIRLLLKTTERGG
jgi:AbiJ-like protein